MPEPAENPHMLENLGEASPGEHSAAAGKPSPTGRLAFRLVLLVGLVGGLLVGGPIVVTNVAPLLVVANKTKIRCDLRAICEAASQYQTMTGRYPASIEEMVDPTDAAGNELPGFEKEPRDPWLNPYVYALRDGKPWAQCLGKDQRPGGEGDDADFEEPERLTAGRNRR